jgi:hypothetical protein
MDCLGPARQTEAQSVEMIGESLAAFGARMDRQTRRLVDDEHKGIAVEEARAYVCYEGIGWGHGPALTMPGPGSKRE